MRSGRVPEAIIKLGLFANDALWVIFLQLLLFEIDFRKTALVCSVSLFVCHFLLTMQSTIF